MSGPNIAGEIARYLPATAVTAAADPRLAERVQGTLSTQWFRVYTNSDMVGVELAGAVKKCGGPSRRASSTDWARAQTRRPPW